MCIITSRFTRTHRKGYLSLHSNAQFLSHWITLTENNILIMTRVESHGQHGQHIEFHISI